MKTQWLTRVFRTIGTAARTRSAGRPSLYGALFVTAGLTFVGCQLVDKRDSGEAARATATVVGVYDSRVIALAYWREEVDGTLRFQNPELCSRAIALEYWSEDIDGKPRYEFLPGGEYPVGVEAGVMMHQQVFGYHDPVQALEHIAEELPGVMEATGVDVIVSKWDRRALAKHGVVGSGWDKKDLVKRNPGRVLDVTRNLVQLYHPEEGILEYVDGAQRSKPYPLDTDWLHAHE